MYCRDLSISLFMCVYTILFNHYIVFHSGFTSVAGSQFMLLLPYLLFPFYDTTNDPPCLEIHCPASNYRVTININLIVMA